MIDPALTGLAGVCCCAVGLRGAALLWGSSALERRELSETVSRRGRRRGPTRLLVDAVGARLGPRLLTRMSDSRRLKALARLDRAGRPGGMNLERYAELRGAAAAFGTVFAILVLALGSWFVAVLCALIGWFGLDVWLSRTGRRRQTRLERDMPDFIDILAITVRAGVGYRGALDRVASSLTGPPAEEILTTLRQMDLGATRREAFEALRARNDSPTLDRFVAVQLQAEELGVPLADALASIAADTRRESQQNARRRAHRTVPKLTLITVTMVLPATMLLIAVGLILGSLYASRTLADTYDLSVDWVGRLVRVLVVFRTFVLLVTIIGLSAHEYRPVVAAAIALAALISYVPMRHWERIGSTVSRHPAYLAVEILISAFVLAAGGVRGPFFYFTLGTAVLAGVIYGRRGAIPFSALLICVYELVLIEGLPPGHQHVDAQTVLFAPLLYPLAVLAGVTAREMVERGARSQALLQERTVALGTERERLRVARELHDSLAKTVEGLAMSASVLPSRCVRSPEAAAELARELADDARRAALEARMLMSDLRPGAAPAQSLVEALGARARTFAERSHVRVELIDQSRDGDGRLSQHDVHELLRIVGEAMTNAVTHGHATCLEVALRRRPDEALTVTVTDDGQGFAGPVDIEQLKAAGHFGLAGMHERARAIDATLLIERREAGTAVSVHFPPPGTERDGAGDPPRLGRRWPGRRRRGAFKPQTATKEAS